MKILVVHNDYGHYSGEEAVVDRMIADGREAGIEIATLRFTSEGYRDSLTGKIRGFFAGIYSIRGCRKMRQILKDFRPDIVHIHNLYPFISPAVLPICKQAGVPVVMTVHNYRLICPTGLFLRDGKPCENCLKNGNEWDCVRYNCEGSRFRSIGYALRNAIARHTRAYLDNVDYYCCLTEFQKQKLIEAGVDPVKIRIFPNYVDYEKPSEGHLQKCGTGFVGYVGRISYEKGYDLLIEVARRHPEITFCFAGTKRERVEDVQLDNVVFCGQLNAAQLARFYEDSRFIVIPSRCYEGVPVALLEASSHSRCCIAPRQGAFPNLLSDNDNGIIEDLLFAPLNVEDLEQKVVALWNDTEKTETLGKLSNKIYNERFLKKTVNQEWITFLQNVKDNYANRH